MSDLLKIVPLVLLVGLAVWLVWRGMRTRPDDTDNRAKGGGAKWDHWR